jgi:hypothetical protein
MFRPLMQSRIGELEDLFATSRSKLDVLRQLEHELQFRQVPRALTLLEQVQQAQVPTSAATGSADSSPGSASAASSAVRPMDVTGQLSLLPTPTLVLAPQVNGHAAISRAQVPTPSLPTAQAPAPAMSLEAAHKLLKVSPGVPWATVELARSKAVQPSSPLLTKDLAADQRARLLATGRLVNEAYAVLASARITKQYANLGGL